VANERGLTGPVSADQAEDDAARDGKRDVVERSLGAELAGEASDFDDQL
jgi:hypothetical protein